MSIRQLTSGSFIFVALLFCMSAGAQRTISINFAGGGGGGTRDNAVSLDPGDVAGVVAKGNWNNATANGQNPINATLNSLTDDTGAVTTASVNYVTPNTWTIGTLPSNPTGDQKMLHGYLDVNNVALSTTVTLSNLPFAQYDVYVYTLGDQSGRNGTYTIGTQSNTTSPTLPFNGTYTLGNNYTLFSDITGDSFTLTAKPTNAAGVRSPVNGIQIVAVPAPGALVTTILGALPGVSLLLRRRRRVT
jgi:hypothetical protein